MLIAQGGANPIELSTNGVVRVYIKDDGNVGIGTMTPATINGIAAVGQKHLNLYYATDVARISIQGAAAILDLVDLDAGASAKHIKLQNSAGVTRFESVDDAGNVQAANILCITNNVGYVGIGTIDPKSALHVVGLPIYANNAAAILGGLTAGAFYRTNADPDPVCVVH
jgi:hypothetical protein